MDKNQIDSLTTLIRKFTPAFTYGQQFHAHLETFNDSPRDGSAVIGDVSADRSLPLVDALVSHESSTRV